jgi:hypothetical protein
MVSVYKRIVWCDTVLRFEGPLTSYGNARITLAPPGAYYRDYLSYNTTYIQEMIPSSDGSTAARADHSAIVERIRDLRHFLEELFQQDAAEVEGVLFQGVRASDYCQVYGTCVFSERIIHVARRNVGAQLSTERIAGWAPARAEAARAELAAWDNYFIEQLVRPTVHRLRRALKRWQL